MGQGVYFETSHSTNESGQDWWDVFNCCGSGYDSSKIVKVGQGEENYNSQVQKNLKNVSFICIYN